MCWLLLVVTLRLKQNGCHLQTTFSDTFSCIKNVAWWLKFHRNWFPRVQSSVSWHWYRWWLGAEKGTWQYLNQLCSALLIHIWGRWPQLIDKCWHGEKSHCLVQQWHRYSILARNYSFRPSQAPPYIKMGPFSGIIQCIGPVNDRWCYIVTSFLIG